MANIVMTVIVLLLCLMALRFIWDRPANTTTQAASVTVAYTGVSATDVVASGRKRLYSQSHDWGRVEVEVESTAYDKRHIGMVRLFQNDKTVLTLWNNTLPDGILQENITNDIRAFVAGVTPIIEKDFPK